MKPIYSGKVREIYDISDNNLVIVTTDRISAFDNILPVLIKDKGIILNKISNFWFDQTKTIVPNHIVDDNTANMPAFFQNEFFRERTVMVEKLNMLPFEFIVRGYLYGSMWKAYSSGGTPHKHCMDTLIAQKTEGGNSAHETDLQRQSQRDL